MIYIHYRLLPAGWFWEQEQKPDNIWIGPFRTERDCLADARASIATAQLRKEATTCS